MFLLFAFILVPIAELYVIGGVADGIGWSWTLLLLFADSVLGAVLVKREGRRAWAAFRDALAAGRWPGDEVAQGALVLIGGALLLTPGFLTDGLGLFLVLPPTRAIAAAIVKRRIVPVPVQVAGDVFGHVRDHRGQQDAPPRPDGRGRHTFDVEVVSVERDEPDELGPSA